MKINHSKYREFKIKVIMKIKKYKRKKVANADILEKGKFFEIYRVVLYCVHNSIL